MVKIVSSESSKNVGRPGFRRFVQNVSNTSKASIRRLMVNDPSKGISQPQANKITDTHIDTIGSGAKGTPVGRRVNTSYGSGRKTIRAAGQRLRKR
jgi:pSer/pThr/pTyr-binding forkhead associated (FHA) protein